MSNLLHQYDIVICGAGLAGLTLALQLRRQRPADSILILEKKAGPLPQGTHKVGESLTEGGTYLIRQLAGLKEYVESTHIKKLGLRFFGGGFRKAAFDERFEIGDVVFARNTSYQLDRGILENDLRRFCRDAGVHIEEGASVKDIDFGPQTHNITFTHVSQGKEATVACRWVVDAMGRRRFLQSKLRITKKSPHEGSACWWRINRAFDVAEMVPRDKSNWHERVFAKRWYSTNHLLGEGYFIWIIPLCSNMTSIGVVADEKMHPIHDRKSMEKSLTWLAEHEPILFDSIKNDQPLDFLALRNFSYTTTKAFSSNRWSCIGEAAAFTDPLYSMGTDLIAIGNRITVRLIGLDSSNSLTTDIAESYNDFYLKAVDVMTEFFRDMYPAFGDDTVMLIKVMWDIACYWAFFSQLSIQDLLYEEQVLPALMRLANRLEAANANVQEAFRSAAAANRKGSKKTGFYNFGGVSQVTDLRARVTDKKDIGELEDNMNFLERFAASLCQFLGSGADEMPAELQPLVETLTSYLTPVAQVGFVP